MTGGSPPTALNARTGLETPPGMYCFARSKTSRERGPGTSVNRGHQEGQEFCEGADADVGLRYFARLTEAAAVHPGGEHTNVLRAQDVGHRVVACVEDVGVRHLQ